MKYFERLAISNQGHKYMQLFSELFYLVANSVYVTYISEAPEGRLRDVTKRKLNREKKIQIKQELKKEMSE